jgi:hypothetical protein
MIHFTHSASYLNDSIYVFGGLNVKDETSATQQIPNNTLLKYNANDSTWTTILPNSKSPIARNWHSSVEFNNELYIFGGKSNGYLNDLWKYDPIVNVWSQIRYIQNDTVPSARYGHKCVVIKNEMYVYGGYDRNGFTCGEEMDVFNLFEFTWRRVKLSGDVPEHCYHHTMCAIPDQQLVVVFGGINSSGTVFNHLVAINCDNGECKTIEYSDNIDGMYGHCSYIEKGSVDNHWSFHVIGGCSKFCDNFNSFYFDINTEDLNNCSVIKTEIANTVFNIQNSSVQCLPTFASVVVTTDDVVVYGGVRNRDKFSPIRIMPIDISVLSQFAQNAPDDIIMVILSFLDRKELVTMRAVSKQWKFSTLSEHNVFWKHIYSSIFKEELYSTAVLRVRLNTSSLTGYKQAINDLRIAYQRCLLQLIDARKRQLLPERKTPAKYSGVTHQYVGKEKLQDMFHNINSKEDMMNTFGTNGTIHGDSDIPHSGYNGSSSGALGAKVVMVGDGAVGKTCLLIRVREKRFPEVYVPTAFDNSTFNFAYCNNTYEIGVWDTAGPEEYDRLR